MNTNKKILKLWAILVLMLLFTNCQEEDPGIQPPVKANLDNFFVELPDWEEFSPAMSSADEPIGETVVDSESTNIGGNPYSCASTAYSITETPDKITTLNPDVEILYVGSLLQGDGHLNGIGSLAELPIRQRAPITLTLDLLSGNNNRTVDNPTVSSVNAAIGDLIEDAQNDGHRSGSSIFYKSESAYSFTQVSLKMGLSASYMGASLQSSLSTNFSQEKRTVTAYFSQQMFTASMVLPQYPEDVFSAEFTEELLEREVDMGRMGSDNPPVYISSIVYGRIMMFSFTSTATELQIKSTLNAIYNGGEFGGELTAEMETIINEAEISVVTVGGDADNALNLIQSNRLSEFFTSDAPLTSAKPISYTVRNLKDNVVARVSETTEYNLRECTEAAPTGAKYKFQLTRIQAVALPDIDRFLGQPIKSAQMYYQLYYEKNDLTVEDAAKFRYPLTLAISEGQTLDLLHEYSLLDIDTPPEIENITLHFDGRDKFTIYGDLWDNDSDLTLYDDNFKVRRTFQGEGANLTYTDNEYHPFSITSSDEFGNVFKIFGRYQRTALLYD